MVKGTILADKPLLRKIYFHNFMINSGMKHFFFSLLLMVLSAQIGVAQNTILMGKIVNEDHEPIAGATLRLSKAGKAVEATSDNDGLFYSRLLASDNYHLDVVVDGKYMRTKKLYLPPAEKKKVFHYLRVVGDKVIITVREDDPFLKNKLSKIEQDPIRTIFDAEGLRMMILEVDTKSGNARPMYKNSPEHFLIEKK